MTTKGLNVKMKENLIISACLLGMPTRYDGKSVAKVDAAKLSEKYNLIPVCPEIYGGLPTPRVPSEKQGSAVRMKDGTDVTENFARGAASTLEIAKISGAKRALLKAKSPSCGKGLIYDGTFTGNKIPGNGVTVELLEQNGIRVFTEEDVEQGAIDAYL